MKYDPMQDKEPECTRRGLANTAVLALGSAPMIGWAAAAFDKAMGEGWYTTFDMEEGDRVNYDSPDGSGEVSVTVEDISEYSVTLGTEYEVTLGVEEDGSYREEVLREGEGTGEVPGTRRSAVGVKRADNEVAKIDVHNELNPEMLEPQG